MKLLLAIDYQKYRKIYEYTRKLIDLSAGVSDDDIAQFCVENIIHGFQREKKFTPWTLTDYYHYLHDQVYCWHVSPDMLYEVNEFVYRFIDEMYLMLHEKLCNINFCYETVIGVNSVICYPPYNLIVCDLGVPNDYQMLHNPNQS